MLFKTVVTQGRREYMEDTHMDARSSTRNYHMFAVFDGHGGAQVSNLCKERIFDVLETTLSTSNRTVRNMDGVMLDVFKHLDTLAIEQFPSSVGSTASVAIVFPQHIVTANCGDSSIIVGYKHGVDVLSRDHKVGNERERLTKLGAAITEVPGDTPRINSQLNLSRSIGDAHLKKFVSPNPFVSIVPKNPNMRYLLIASDGLWDVFSFEEVHTYVMTRILAFPIVSDALLDLSLSDLVRLALTRGSTDNITVTLVLL